MRRHWKTNALFLSFCCTGVVLWIIYRNDHPIQTYTQEKKKVNVMEKINKTPKTQLNKKLMEPHGKLQNTKNITNAKLQKYLLQPHTNIHHTKNKNKRYSHGEDKTMRIKDYLGAPYPYHEVQNAKERYSQANQDQVVYDILQKKAGSLWNWELMMGSYIQTHCGLKGNTGGQVFLSRLTQNYVEKSIN